MGKGNYVPAKLNLCTIDDEYL